MNQIQLRCSVCSRAFFRTRTTGRVNEARKFGWKPYCSPACQTEVRRKAIERSCSNPSCRKRVICRQVDQTKRPRSFCSHSCAAVFYNTRRPRKYAPHPCQSPVCGTILLGAEKFCSREHSIGARKIPTETYKTLVIEKIYLFYQEQQRVPLKREMVGLYKTAIDLFGSWNKAIEAAGLDPNPLRFAERQVAADGHLCASIAEKLIDNWFSGNRIRHERNVFYPDQKHTVDFFVNGVFVEFFGLKGELQEYDRHIRIKERLAKNYGLPLVKVYPKDIYPFTKLDSFLQAIFLSDNTFSV